MGEQSRQLPIQDMENQLTLSQPDGVDFIPLLLLAHPDLGSYITERLISV